MNTNDWRQQWDDHATDEATSYEKLPISVLITKIKTRSLGEYSTIWGTLAERATLPEVGWLLYDFLRSDREYLDRYHCAAALLKLMPCPQFTPVDLSAKRGDNLERNLQAIHTLLTDQIGNQQPT